METRRPKTPRRLPAKKRAVLGTLCLVIATAIWLPSMHLFFRKDLGLYFSKDRVAPKARQLATTHIRIWTDPNQLEQMTAKARSDNPEWDFMGRTFLVLALTNMSLSDYDAKQHYLEIADRVIAETLRLEEQGGIFHFLMGYAKTSPFVCKHGKSLFLDGEIALMLAARQMVEVRDDYGPLLRERVDSMMDYMQKSPVLSGESYPDECWTFCNSIALAAVAMSDVLDGRDHSDFCAKWVQTARERLLHQETGLLLSSYTFDGRPKDGPEGSSIWMAAHCLQLVDEQFARDQYLRAKKELAGSLLGFGFAREWPGSWKGPCDVDAGVVIPVLQLSPSSSGLAFIAASAFGDREFLGKLLNSLNLAGFPVRRDDTLAYCASNQVGQTVLLYSMVLGPLWQKVKAAQSTENGSVSGEAV